MFLLLQILQVTDVRDTGFVARYNARNPARAVQRHDIVLDVGGSGSDAQSVRFPDGGWGSGSWM